MIEVLNCGRSCPPLNRESLANHQPLRAERCLDPVTFATLRRKTILEACKWDPQVGDGATLAPFPLVIKSSTWLLLAAMAENLAAEAIRAEEEILHEPRLLAVLGLPRSLLHALTGKAPVSASAGRVMRFDFHFTASGWRISEANTDVPGGFTEASFFTALMAEHFPALRAPGSPAASWADALAEAAGPGGMVALLSAPGYMEDHQVIAFLAAQLRERGCDAHLARPKQILWRKGHAFLETSWYRGGIDALIRFYQSEWLANLPAACRWENFFRGSQTPVANPGLAVISESKRFPIATGFLSTQLPTWQALLPETCDPRDAPWPRDESWLVKAAFCNTGDTVSIREFMPRAEWLQTLWSVRLRPGKWVAQRRFESVPIRTPIGPRHACLGVYTINGRAAGAYVRLAAKPLIDFSAMDVALLLEEG